MELIKNYDYTIAYHPRKANVVVDALSRKSPNPKSRERITLLKELRGFKVVLNVGTSRNLMAHFL